MTNEIKFRKLTSPDAPRLIDIYGDKEAMKYRGSPPILNTKEAQNYVDNQKHIEGQTTTIRQGIETVQPPQLIGSIMYRYNEIEPHECAIGYSIGRAYWGQGYGHKIVQKMVNALNQKKDIRKIIAWCHLENVASIKILEKNGFTLQSQDEINNQNLYVREIRPSK